MNRVAVAAEVVAGLSTRLVGRSEDGFRVSAVLHYGAVDVDPRHLVVWILLDGRPDEEIPAWFQVVPDVVEPPPYVGLEWLLELRSSVVDAFTAAGWSDEPRVLVDSRARVDAEGWNYFR